MFTSVTEIWWHLNFGDLSLSLGYCLFLPYFSQQIFIECPKLIYYEANKNLTFRAAYCALALFKVLGEALYSNAFIWPYAFVKCTIVRHFHHNQLRPNHFPLRLPLLFSGTRGLQAFLEVWLRDSWLRIHLVWISWLYVAGSVPSVFRPLLIILG